MLNGPHTLQPLKWRAELVTMVHTGNNLPVEIVYTPIWCVASRIQPSCDGVDSCVIYQVNIISIIVL